MNALLSIWMFKQWTEHRTALLHLWKDVLHISTKIRKTYISDSFGILSNQKMCFQFCQLYNKYICIKLALSDDYAKDKVLQ